MQGLQIERGSIGQKLCCMGSNPEMLSGEGVTVGHKMRGYLWQLDLLLPSREESTGRKHLHKGFKPDVHNGQGIVHNNYGIMMAHFQTKIMGHS